MQGAEAAVQLQRPLVGAKTGGQLHTKSSSKLPKSNPKAYQREARSSANTEYIFFFIIDHRT